MTSDAEFDFTFGVAADERHELLDQAARIAAGLDSHLGSDAPRGEVMRSPELQQLIELDADVVEVAYPDVHLLDKDTLAAVGVELPVWLRDAAAREDVYWIQFPIFLKHRADSGFSRLEFEVRFSVEGDPALQPRAHEIFPAKKFETMASAGMLLSLRLDEELRFAGEASTTPAANSAGVALSAHTQAGAGFRAEFEYEIKKARIDHSGLGTSRVFWRIDGSSYLQEGAPSFVVITRIPKRAGEQVQVTATAQGSRAFSLLGADLREIIKRLPERIIEFFRKGAPVRDQKTFTNLLAKS